MGGRGFGDHFNGAGVFGAGFDDKRRGAHEALEAGAFFEGDGAAAGDLAADVAIDNGGGGGDGVEKFDAHALFDAEVAALDGADDFPMVADDDIPGAYDGGGQFAQDGEMVAAQRDSGDRTGFLDDHIATGLDPAVPWAGDVVIEQADVATTLRTLTGLRFGHRGERMTAIETGDFPGRFRGVEQAHQ